MKSVNITYFGHGTTTDNESHKASGWFDVELSELGIKQTKELRIHIKDRKFDVVFCSNLTRAIDSAINAFGNSVPIIHDKRLRESNYGDFTRADNKKIENMMIECIEKPFPNGESYKDVEKRIRDFLKDLLENYSGKTVAVFSHRAPQLALDVLLKGKTWEQAIKEDWRPRKGWKPGWDYVLEESDIPE